MTSIGKKFSFVSLAPSLTADTFDVVSFSGTEGLSKLYQFEVTLVSENDEIDLESVTQSRAKLTILRDNGNIVFNGILSELEQMGTAQGRTQYRAVLTPAFWRHTLTHHNQIFLDQTVPQIIESALKSGGLTSLDYEFRLTGVYPPHEYICQYSESLYDFISRLLEREGIYYFFEQNADSEKVIITDTALLHSVMTEGVQMSYSPPSGLDEASREEVISTLVCRQKILPARVLLKDYNYRKPSLELTAECVVSERGQGDVYIYGEHFATSEEGTRLAQVRADELKCRAKTFHGESLIPYLRPGYLFSLAGHNRADFNTSYLTLEITHHGDQAFMLSAGLSATLSDRERSPYYRNSFSAIPSNCQFRPERITSKPRISGTLNAHIDAEGSGQYAEVDDQGRYKVILPFDLNTSMGGKASSWLRMAQPYAGENHGMHFPLHKGTEVLLTFIDGDPDRPIIAAAVPNPITPSPVNSSNCTQSHVTTAGGNKLHFEDQKGRERIVMQTPNSNSMFRVGAQKTAEQASTSTTSTDSSTDGIHATTKGTFTRESTMYNTLTLGEEMNILVGSSYNIYAGTETSINVGTSVDMSLGLDMEVSFGGHVEWYGGTWYTSCKENELVGRNSVEIKAGGDSPLLSGLMKAMVLVALADTAVVAGLSTMDSFAVDETNPNETHEKNQSIFACVSGAAYGVILTILEFAIWYQTKHDPVKFKSEIVLDENKIKMQTPFVLLQTETALSIAAEAAEATVHKAKNWLRDSESKLTEDRRLFPGLKDEDLEGFDDWVRCSKFAAGAEQKAADAAAALAQEDAGDIKIQAFRNINNTSVGITNTATVDIINTAAGNITNSATLDITNAAEGALINTAEGEISNTTMGEMTNTATVINLNATTEMSLFSGGILGIEAAGDISLEAASVTMNAIAEFSIEGATITIDGLIINIG